MGNLDILIRNMIYLRKKNGWNQERLAAELDTNRSVIGSYEQKIAKPSIEVLVKISEKFKIDLEKLLYIDLKISDIDLNNEDGVNTMKEAAHEIDINYEFVRLTQKMVELYEENKKLKEKLYYINNLNKN